MEQALTEYLERQEAHAEAMYMQAVPEHAWQLFGSVQFWLIAAALVLAWCHFGAKLVNGLFPPKR